MTNLILYLSLFGIIIGLSNCGVIVNQNQVRTGKINIYTGKDGMHCGSLICPIGSRCIVTQRNHPNDTIHLVTREKCFDEDDNLIEHNELTETVDASEGLISRRYEVSAHGIQITDPKQAREIQENIEKTIHNVELSLKNAFSTPLFSGGLFGDSWPFGVRNNPFHRNFPFYDVGKDISDESDNVSNTSAGDETSKVDGTSKGEGTSKNKESTREELENYNKNEHNDVNL